MSYPPQRLAFAGTPEFAAACLAAMIEHDHVPGLVFTQPDRPAGRGRRLLASPVKQLAERHGIEVLQPARMDQSTADTLAEHGIELMVVVAYGQIVPPSVLTAPSLGCWNIHASLLPRWRGAAPIQRAIAAGDNETGVCLMQMDQGLDTGPVLASRKLAIDGDDTAASLHDRLASAGAALLVDILNADALPEAVAQPQAGVCYAHKLNKQEAALDFSRPAVELERQVRAFNPFPVATAEFAGQRLRLFAAQALPALEPTGAPGCIERIERDGIDVATGQGCLRLTRLQRPGGKALAVTDFLAGAANLGLTEGACFD